MTEQDDDDEYVEPFGDPPFVPVEICEELAEDEKP